MHPKNIDDVCTNILDTEKIIHLLQQRLKTSKTVTTFEGLPTLE